MTDKIEVTQADVERKMRWQQRFLTEGIGESELLDEEFAAHRLAGERAGMERAAMIAAGQYPDHSMYHEDSPMYGSDLNPDRSEFGRGKEAGSKGAAQAIRAQAGEQADG